MNKVYFISKSILYEHYIGHKDTLFIIPPFYPQSSLKAGDQYKGKDMILRAKIWTQDLDISRPCAKNTLALPEDHDPVSSQDQEA